MINNEYDLLKYLFAHMDTKTHRYTDANLELTELIGSEKVIKYLTALKEYGFIKVFVGNQEIELLEKAINYIIN